MLGLKESEDLAGVPSHSIPGQRWLEGENASHKFSKYHVMFCQVPVSGQAYEIGYGRLGRVNDTIT